MGPSCCTESPKPICGCCKSSGMPSRFIPHQSQSSWVLVVRNLIVLHTVQELRVAQNSSLHGCSNYQHALLQDIWDAVPVQIANCTFALSLEYHRIRNGHLKRTGEHNNCSDRNFVPKSTGTTSFQGICPIRCKNLPNTHKLLRSWVQHRALRCKTFLKVQRCVTTVRVSQKCEMVMTYLENLRC